MDFDLPTTAIFVVVTIFTPGPNNIISASLGALYGYRKTLPFLCGVVAGFLVINLLCATLSSVLLNHFPAVAPLLRYVGGLYILWLAWGIYRGSGKFLSDPGDAEPLRFWNGAILQLVNPKAIFFGLTVYSVFLAPLMISGWALVGSPLVLGGVTFSAISTWAVGGHLIRGWIRTPARSRALGVVLAGALVYTALDLADLLPW